MIGVPATDNENKYRIIFKMRPNWPTIFLKNFFPVNLPV